eukprot:9491002-Pyramimonas_sp.AAC.1
MMLSSTARGPMRTKMERMNDRVTLGRTTQNARKTALPASSAHATSIIRSSTATMLLITEQPGKNPCSSREIQGAAHFSS